MDYIKIYNNLINYCKNNSIEDRLLKRDKNDFRIGKNYIYVENHHIIPTHDGGENFKENMVLLLPEEHIFAHKIRWKAFKQRGDMLAVRFCLNGILNPKNIEIKKIRQNYKITKNLRQGYIWIKQNSAEVRKTHGWQTKEGAKRISEARKNTMPVKDKTGKIIGSVSVNHPKVLSGEWVHHTTGFLTTTKIETGEKVRISSKEYQENKELYLRLDQSGEKNPNFNKLFTKELLLELAYNNLNIIIENNIFLSNKMKKLVVDLINEKKIFKKKIKNSSMLTRRFGSNINFINELNVKFNLNIIYDKNYRSEEQRQKLREVNLGKKKG